MAELLHPQYIVVLITAPKEEEGAKIAHTLVSEGLGACINIVKDIRSIYTWKGKIEDESEVLLVIKTRFELFEKLCKRAKELHSYEVPEIIALPIIAGSDSYLKWIDESTGKERDS